MQFCNTQIPSLEILMGPSGESTPVTGAKTQRLEFFLLLDTLTGWQHSFSCLPLLAFIFLPWLKICGLKPCTCFYLLVIFLPSLLRTLEEERLGLWQCWQF